MERISNRVIAVLFFNIIYSNKKFINIIDGIKNSSKEKSKEEIILNDEDNK